LNDILGNEYQGIPFLDWNQLHVPCRVVPWIGLIKNANFVHRRKISIRIIQDLIKVVAQLTYPFSHLINNTKVNFLVVGKEGQNNNYAEGN
jgi:hypothetical protein